MKITITILITFIVTVVLVCVFFSATEHEQIRKDKNGDLWTEYYHKPYKLVPIEIDNND